MTFPVVGSNIPSAYQISNSLRFNNDDSPKLTFTPSSAGNRRTFTLSVWFKLSVYSTGERVLLAADDGTGGNNNFDYIAINGNDKLFVYGYEGAENQQLVSTQLFRDPSAWYHLVVAFDTTQSTASNRIKAYVNGNQITDFDTANYPSQNFQTRFNNSNEQRISSYPDQNTSYFDGYMAEFNFIDGQALSPTDFGEFDLDSGVWKPKQYVGTYGTNGFYLKFNNTGNMGEDSSGNDNTWTPTNLSGTTDVTTDTPTNNFATLNALQTSTSSSALQEGNTNFTVTANGASLFRNTLSTVPFPSSGKWYMETKVTHTNLTSDSGNQVYVGVVQNQANINALSTSNVNSISNNGFFSDVRIVGTISDAIQSGTNGSATSYDTNPDWSSGNIIGIAIDMDNGKIYYHLNGTYYNDSGGTTANPSAGTNPNATFTAGMELTYFQSILRYNTSNVEINANFGNPSYSISSGNNDDNGYGNFEYAPPSGYLALCTQNLATALSPTIDDGSQYFNTVLYTGNASTNNITGVGFQPDFSWLKERNNARSHCLYDSVRGATLKVNSDATQVEVTDADGLTSFDTDGFTLGADSSTNGSGNTYASWNWLASGSTASNTDGSITSTVSANTTAGFSIVTYTGTGTTGTVGHGLGKVPRVLITKDRDDSFSWNVYHAGIASDAETDYLVLEGTDAAADNVNRWNDTAPTSSVFTVASSSPANTSGNNILAYCFAEIEGYSKFGSYTGNGSSDGTFVYTGFRPAFVIVKTTSRTGDWIMEDTTRSTYNPVDDYLRANGSNAEVVGTSSAIIDFTSNGFKCRANGFVINESSTSYVYMAFAENPFVTSGAVPVTAR